jgi:hypothetical protein
MIAKVPMIDTGTATSGMIEARQVCRKMMTTITTRMMASSRVCSTPRSTGARTRSGRRRSRSGPRRGRPWPARPSWRAPVGDLERVRARGLDDRHRGRGLVVEQAAQAVGTRRRVRRAPHRAAAPADRHWRRATMMFSNSLVSTRRPWVVMVSSKAVACATGCWARVPAATWRFCSRIASHDIGGGEAARRHRSGSSQTRRLYSPDPKTGHIADARQAGELILDVEAGVVGQSQRFEAVGLGLQVHHHEQVEGGFACHHAQPADIIRQARRRLLHAVLHVDQLLIEVGADGGRSAPGPSNRRACSAMRCRAGRRGRSSAARAGWRPSRRWSRGWRRDRRR